MSDGCTVIEGDKIQGYRMLVLRSALKLEIAGLKNSHGSVYALIKREFGLKGNKQAVYDRFCDLVEEKLGISINR